MAPTKRPAPYSGDDEAEVGQRQARHSPSTPHASSSKKRRRTSDESSLARDQDASSDQGDASTPPSDFGSDEEGEFAEAELAATQAIEERKQSSRTHNNEPVQHGILEEVELENFMCHDKYAFKLGPLINFICGKNGSGKSAILTAIVLCLGGKASATNRGARLQNFIKEGRDHARIICKIKNQGESAYMPDLYGDTIQVERHFSRAGGSGFKLKSERGRIISTRKSDLEDICDHMILQMENPMTVLSQDQARQFLSSSSSAEKYRLFMKGVHLEQLDQDYKIIEEQQENIHAKIEAKRPDLKDLQKKHESAKNKQELSRRYEGMLAKIREFRRQLAWAQVAAQEALREEFAQSIREADEKIQAEETKLAEADRVYQDSDRAAAIAREAYDSAKQVFDKVQDDKKEAKARHDEIKKDTSAAQAEQRTIHAALKEADDTITKKQEAIQQEEQRLAELNGGGAGRRITALKDAEGALRQARQNAADHKGQRKQLEEDVKRMENLKKEAEESQNNHNARVQEQERNLTQLEQTRQNKDLAFHTNMPALLKALQRETGFQQTPIGPLGKHVRLLKPEWSTILEKYFGSALNSFIVTSKRDETLLTSIMKRARCVVNVFILSQDPIDTTPNEPDSRFVTVLKVLEIDNELVKKQLVIGNAIEQTILIPDLTEASNTLFGGEPLRNVKRCFCFGTDRRRGGVLLSLRNGHAAQDPAHAWTGTPRMATDIDDLIRRQQETIADMKDQRRRMADEFRSAQDRHEKAKQALVRHDKATNNLVVAVQRAEDEVERLADEIKADNVESGTLEVLRQALKEAEDQKTVHEGSYQDSVIACDDLKARLREANRQLKDFDDRIKEAQDAADDAQRLAQNADKRRAFNLHEKNSVGNRINDANGDRDRLVADLAELDAKIEKWTAEAQKISERVNIPDGETYESLDKKYRRLTEDYNKYQDRIGDRDQIAAEATKWKKAYDNAQAEMQGLETLRDKLNETMVQRKFRWKQFRSFISAHAKAQFMYMLSERGFRGTLIMDHQKKMMDLRVEPDITRRDGSGRSARTLSGGEKSYSQVCLLLAMWEAMGAPIRCLDEFDVFMDAVNRNISVNLLIDGARQSIGRQFILISPGTKSDIKSAPDVKVHEVAAPERGQTRLVLASA
ncbi:myosin ATPase [Exophiala viscosa]|uniref:Myosin ATPase n=1 Tax=Exophiala viscosa TaxID=2486360 RepID=A0AAN6DMN9_9EURO|nr:myosin ATPase [Exophiala viscosa]